MEDGADIASHLRDFGFSSRNGGTTAAESSKHSFRIRSQDRVFLVSRRQTLNTALLKEVEDGRIRESSLIATYKTQCVPFATARSWPLTAYWQ